VNVLLPQPSTRWTELDSGWYTLLRACAGSDKKGFDVFESPQAMPKNCTNNSVLLPPAHAYRGSFFPITPRMAGKRLYERFAIATVAKLPNGAPVKNPPAARENHKKDTLPDQLSLAIRPGNANL